MNVERLFQQPAHRREWLLMKALECAPLDQAISLARAADDFVVGEGQISSNLAPPKAAPESTIEVSSNRSEALNSNPADPAAHAEHSRIALTRSDRDRLLGRAAKGAKNSELAVEFGLAPRQVQALRMGAARAAARCSADAAIDVAPMISATVEEVVRYLRQRDDVVVPEGDGFFRVNGRFRLGFSELVAKANRARERQNKPLFNVEGISQDKGVTRSREDHHVCSDPRLLAMAPLA